MPADPSAQTWAIRSNLVAVTDLDRSIAFYGELGPFDLIVREDAVAVLGHVSPQSTLLILRQLRDFHRYRHGQQSLGLRSITFNVGSIRELDRIEPFLRGRGLLTSRRKIADGESDLLRGRDPDNLPLAFVCYPNDTLKPDYYQTIADLAYSLDI